MPLLKVATSAPLESVDRPAFLKQASADLATALGKPESYMMIQLEPAPDLIFGGTAEPAAYVELKSIGLPADKTEQLSQNICSLIEQKLGVPPKRIYIEFASAAGAMWGWNSTTF